MLELHEGRKAEEEAFKEQRQMEDNIKRRLLLRWMEHSLKSIHVFLPGREMNWLDSTGGKERKGKRRRRSTIGGWELLFSYVKIILMQNLGNAIFTLQATNAG